MLTPVPVVQQQYTTMLQQLLLVHLCVYHTPAVPGTTAVQQNRLGVSACLYVIVRARR